MKNFVLFIVLITFFSACSEVKYFKIEAKKGVIDLTTWNLERNEVIVMQGEMEFYWNELLFSSDFSNNKIKPQYNYINGSWHLNKNNPKGVKKQGFATVRFVIKLPKTDQALAIQAMPPLTASRLFINGKEIFEIGKVGKTAQTSLPKYDNKLITIETDSSELEIIYQVSNFHHIEGGMQHYLRLGNAQKMHDAHTLSEIVNILLLGIILAMSVYHFGLFFTLRKNTETLYFAIFSFLVFARMFVAANHFEVYFFNIPWRWVIFTELASITVALPFFYLYFDSIFKGIIYKKVLYFVLSANFILFLFLVFSKPIFYLNYLNYFLVWMGVNAFFIIYAFSIAWIKKIEFSNIFAIGILILILTIFNDILQNKSVIESRYMTHFGWFTFMLSQVYLISKKFANAFIVSERLRTELSYINENLEKTVAERTQKISFQNKQIENQMSKLNEAYVELSENQKFKQDLMNMVVHDLKNPLGVILSTPEDGFLNGTYEKVIKSAQTMKNLVLNILDIGKYEAQKMSLTTELLYLNTELQAVLKEVEFLREEKNLEFRMHNTSNYKIKSDKNLLFRILVNLITNAIKFSPQNKSIDIKVEEYGKNELKISIIDYGEGISQENLQFIFKKFEQVKSKEVGKIQSTGLGLAFCKLATEQLGNQIGVISERNKSTEFWFTVEKVEVKIEEMTKVKIEQTSLQLKPCETNALTPFLEQLRQYEIYQFTNINEILNSIPETSESIIHWKANIHKAIIRQNNKLYQELIN